MELLNGEQVYVEHPTPTGQDQTSHVGLIAHRDLRGPGVELEDQPRIVLLLKDRPKAWGLMEQARPRIRKFCERYDTDSDPNILIQSVDDHFAMTSPQVIVMVAAIGAAVVGHLLACIDTWCAKKYVTILQYEIDKGSNIPRDLLRAGFDVLGEWGEMHGARDFQAQVRDSKMEIIFSRFFNFKSVRTLMRRAI